MPGGAMRHEASNTTSSDWFSDAKAMAGISLPSTNLSL